MAVPGYSGQVGAFTSDQYANLVQRWPIFDSYCRAGTARGQLIVKCSRESRAGFVPAGATRYSGGRSVRGSAPRTPPP